MPCAGAPEDGAVTTSRRADGAATAACACVLVTLVAPLVWAWRRWRLEQQRHEYEDEGEEQHLFEPASQAAQPGQMLLQVCGVCRVQSRGLAEGPT